MPDSFWKLAKDAVSVAFASGGQKPDARISVIAMWNDVPTGPRRDAIKKRVDAAVSMLGADPFPEFTALVAGGTTTGKLELVLSDCLRMVVRVARG